jgi:hypothetical protein
VENHGELLKYLTFCPHLKMKSESIKSIFLENKLKLNLNSLKNNEK